MDVGFYDGQEIPIEAVEEYEDAVNLIADLHALCCEHTLKGDTTNVARLFLEQTDVKLFLESENGQASKTKTQTDQTEEA